MNRYHKEVFTEAEHWQRLRLFTERVNCLNWHYSGHCLENIKSRIIDLEDLLRFVKGLKLEAGQIFEYYFNDRAEPIKVCYRINWLKDLDIILVLNGDKEIITIYINSKEDKHETLKRELYING
jgi:hypothetical protein